MLRHGRRLRCFGMAQHQPGAQQLLLTLASGELSRRLECRQSDSDRNNRRRVMLNVGPSVVAAATKKSTTTKITRNNQCLYYLNYFFHHLKLHQHQSMRSFAAFGTNWKLSRNPKKKKRAEEKSKQKKSKPKQTPHPTAKKNPTLQPPAFLIRTGSPHVYVAQLALEQTGVDPQSLLVSMTSSRAVAVEDKNTEKYSDTAEHYGDPDTAGRLSLRTQPPQNNNFVFRYYSPQQLAYEYPNFPEVREVAVLGRSNVGKSSLLNALMRNHKLARTSKQPGRTQLPQYFGCVSNRALASSSSSPSSLPPPLGFLVDLPGYGYAVGPDDAVDKWQNDTQTFLIDRFASGKLVRVYLLVDARHGAQPLDWTLMGWLDDAQIPYTLVLTKADAALLPMKIKWINLICMRYHHQHQQHQQQQDDDDEEEEEGDSNGSGGCTMSPLVYITSANAATGLTELLFSIQNDWLGHDSADWASQRDIK